VGIYGPFQIDLDILSPTGFEPVTCSLKVKRSTPELWALERC